MNSQRPYNLERIVEASLKDPYPEPWLPELTASLAEWGWKALRRSIGIMAADYGTGRVLAGRDEAKRYGGPCLPILVGTDESTCKITIEFLTGECISQYQDIGLTFCTLDELANSTVPQCLQDAIDVLAQVPTLQKTVATLIQTCHILKPEDDAYDVSYSDPRVPFSVFVSVPQKCGSTDTLRVAESLVHEAMHLQLTLIERLQPLVHPSNHTYFSPWRGSRRPPQGILHALYVFRVIDSLFERLLAIPGRPVASVKYLRNRRYEIAQQIRDIKTFEDHPALTELGTYFVKLLVSG